MRSIHNQITSAVRESAAFGQSKHAADKDIRHDGRTYSYDTMASRMDVAKQFATYVQQNHPDVHKAVDIDAKIVQEWLDSKVAAGLTQDTLTRYTSEIRAVMRECGNLYHHNYDRDIKAITTPQSLRNGPIRTATPMDSRTIQALHDSYAKGTNGDKACCLSYAAGLRADGITSVRREDITIINKDYATVQATEKGGRTRTVDVYGRTAVDMLQQVVDHTRPGERCVPIHENSIEKSFARHLDQLGVREPYCITHSMRKDWAQREYDRYRQDHSKRETIMHVNQELGHGAERDEDLLSRYVGDMA